MAAGAREQWSTPPVLGALLSIEAGAGESLPAMAVKSNGVIA
ncbi:hypothetical protein OHA40_03535 [Nocardia sp. NBC_00508]|nr:hypothetical protein [Nocardia sp. NBC_00508]WUD70218.1 hypothetical protein OHA40_03535 [Nocardia sp. NBC_00508]